MSLPIFPRVQQTEIMVNSAIEQSSNNSPLQNPIVVVVGGAGVKIIACVCRRCNVVGAIVVNVVPLPFSQVLQHRHSRVTYITLWCQLERACRQYLFIEAATYIFG